MYRWIQDRDAERRRSLALLTLLQQVDRRQVDPISGLNRLTHRFESVRNRSTTPSGRRNATLSSVRGPNDVPASLGCRFHRKRLETTADWWTDFAFYDRDRGPDPNPNPSLSRGTRLIEYQRLWLAIHCPSTAEVTQQVDLVEWMHDGRLAVLDRAERAAVERQSWSDVDDVLGPRRLVLQAYLSDQGVHVPYQPTV